ncbi:MAG: hypothetical protein D6760_12775, partial [Deltaproteobacteria bacterium]
MVACALAVATVAETQTASAWWWSIAGSEPTVTGGGGRAVAIDGLGDVAVAGNRVRAVGSTFEGDFTVAKLDGVTGATRWIHAFAGSLTWASHEATDVEATAGGDVIAAGRVSNVGSGSDLVVVRLAGSDGSEVWRTTINGSAGAHDEARSIDLDQAGDVLVGGLIANAAPEQDVGVLKLAGSDGSEIWRLPTDFGVRAIVVDPAGNAVAGGNKPVAPSLTAAAVVKAGGADGSILWTWQTPDGERAHFETVATDGEGNVLVAGDLSDGDTYPAFVAKVAGSSGEQLWLRRLPRSFVASVVADAAGNVVAVGSRSDRTTTYQQTMVWKLRGNDGRRLWRTAIG